MAPAPVIRLHPDDGVLIARSSLPPGMVVADGVTTVERIPAGHKVAIKPIAVGEPVRRYGQIIGFADRADRAGPARPHAKLRHGRFRQGLCLRRRRRSRCRISICRRPSRASAVPTAASRRATISASSPR